MVVNFFIIIGDEIEKELSPLVFGPYYMPYLYVEGQISKPPRHTEEEWDEAHAPAATLLNKEIPAELPRVDIMSLLKLSSRMNVLTALLVSHGTEMNVRYSSLAHSAERLQTKVKYKVGQVGDLSFELSTLKEINGKLEEQCHDCGKKNKKLRKVNDSLSVEVKILEDQVYQVEDAYARMVGELAEAKSNLVKQEADLKEMKHELSL
ncbi:hypothetical protein Tco_0959013 [Tanacetum coccineum]